MSENKGTSFLSILLWIYVVISQIMTVVFFIDLCKEWDSIIKIIFLGPFLAELKGLLWFFFIW